jgi:hypothetical protein
MNEVCKRVSALCVRNLLDAGYIGYLLPNCLVVYEHSVDNVNLIQSLGHDVHYEVDATCLMERYHDDEKFDLIQFNFPHWRGKTNARRNRRLLHDFFQASLRILTPNGHVVTALMNHQGGAFASNIQEWKQSWLPAQYAAKCGLLLTRVEPFEVCIQNQRPD